MCLTIKDKFGEPLTATEDSDHLIYKEIVDSVTSTENNRMIKKRICV